jgi:hypothetical protein
MPSIKQFETREKYNEWFRNYRLRNEIKLREYKREYNKKWRKENGYEANKRYENKYPEKISAKTLLNSAVKLGKIIKKPCEVCGNLKAQAHHSDYYKPLEVNWLCALHHKEEHKKISTGKEF